MPVFLIITKDISKKKIMIDRNYRFFIIANLILFVKNNLNCDGILSSR